MAAVNIADRNRMGVPCVEFRRWELTSNLPRESRGLELKSTRHAKSHARGRYQTKKARGSRDRRAWNFRLDGNLLAEFGLHDRVVSLGIVVAIPDVAPGHIRVDFHPIGVFFDFGLAGDAHHAIG